MYHHILFLLCCCLLFSCTDQSKINTADIANASHFYAYQNADLHLIDQNGKAIIPPNSPLRFDWEAKFPDYFLLTQKQSIELYQAGKATALFSIPKDENDFYNATNLIQIGEKLYVRHYIHNQSHYYNLEGKNLLQTSKNFFTDLNADYHLFNLDDIATVYNSQLDSVYSFNIKQFYVPEMSTHPVLKQIITLKEIDSKYNIQKLVNLQTKKELICPFPRPSLSDLSRFLHYLQTDFDLLSQLEDPIFLQFQEKQLQALSNKSLEEIHNTPCITLYNKDFDSISTVTYKQLINKYHIPETIAHLSLYKNSPFYYSIGKDSIHLLDFHCKKIFTYSSQEMRLEGINKLPNYLIADKNNGLFELYHYEDSQLKKQLSFESKDSRYHYWRATADKNYIHAQYKDSLLLCIDLKNNQFKTIDWNTLIQKPYNATHYSSFLDKGLYYLATKNEHVFYYDQEDNKFVQKTKSLYDEDFIIDIPNAKIIGSYAGSTQFIDTDGKADFIKQISPDSILSLFDLNGQLIVEEPYSAASYDPIFQSELKNISDLKTIVNTLGKTTNIPTNKLEDKVALFLHLDITNSLHDDSEIIHFSKTSATSYNNYELDKAIDKGVFQPQAEDYLIIQKERKGSLIKKDIFVYQVAK